MNFKELSEPSKERAVEALCAILASSGVHTEEKAKTAGEFVCAAFVAMERFDSAPDVCGDSKPCEGREKGQDHLDKDHDGG